MYIMNMYTMHIYSLIYICACVGSVCVCVIRDMAAGRGRHTVRRWKSAGTKYRSLKMQITKRVTCLLMQWRQNTKQANQLPSPSAEIRFFFIIVICFVCCVFLSPLLFHYIFPHLSSSPLSPSFLLKKILSSITTIFNTWQKSNFRHLATSRQMHLQLTSLGTAFTDKKQVYRDSIHLNPTVSRLSTRFPLKSDQPQQQQQHQRVVQPLVAARVRCININDFLWRLRLGLTTNKSIQWNTYQTGTHACITSLTPLVLFEFKKTPSCCAAAARNDRCKPLHIHI